jgi:hypothetical protein
MITTPAPTDGHDSLRVVGADGAPQPGEGPAVVCGGELGGVEGEVRHPVPPDPRQAIGRSPMTDHRIVVADGMGQRLRPAITGSSGPPSLSNCCRTWPRFGQS